MSSSVKGKRENLEKAMLRHPARSLCRVEDPCPGAGHIKEAVIMALRTVLGSTPGLLLWVQSAEVDRLSQCESNAHLCLV